MKLNETLIAVEAQILFDAREISREIYKISFDVETWLKQESYSLINFFYSFILYKEFLVKDMDFN